MSCTLKWPRCIKLVSNPRTIKPVLCQLDNNNDGDNDDNDNDDDNNDNNDNDGNGNELPFITVKRQKE